MYLTSGGLLIDAKLDPVLLIAQNFWPNPPKYHKIINNARRNELKKPPCQENARISASGPPLGTEKLRGATFHRTSGAPRCDGHGW